MEDQSSSYTAAFESDVVVGGGGFGRDLFVFGVAFVNQERFHHDIPSFGRKDFDCLFRTVGMSTRYFTIR
jgi:hypothetical protein